MTSIPSRGPSKPWATRARCLHPLLAVIAEARLVAQLWLRSGNSSCATNVLAFFLELWSQTPRQVRWRTVRADSGFCVPELLALWEQLRLRFIVVAKLSVPIQSLIRYDGVSVPTELVGTNIAEVQYQAQGWQTKVTIQSLRFWLFITPG